MKIETEFSGADSFSTLAFAAFLARMRYFAIARSAGFLALFLLPTLSAATIFKCTARDGGITYTDASCPADTTVQHIDPAGPTAPDLSSQVMETGATLPDVDYQGQPEILAVLCANDEFKVWLKAQRHGLPERDVRKAKFIRLSNLCRRALSLPDLSPSIRDSIG